MRIIGLAGWSGSGKTTLLAKIIPCLVARGYTVSTVKHAHHNFDVDTPGKDSYIHRMSGATEVVVGSNRRWALMHELRDEPEPSIYDLLPKMSLVDLVLVEGFKAAQHTRIEVFRHEVGKPPLHPDNSQIVGVVSDTPFPDAGRPVVHIDDLEGVVDMVLAKAERLEAMLARVREPPSVPSLRPLPNGRQGGENRNAGEMMVQLTDDCFAFSGPLLPIADMDRLIAERITPVTEVEQITLDDALGRIVAADVMTTEDLPPFDNAAVDGFAVRHADLNAGTETRLVIAERVMAGHAAPPLAPNVAIRIFTGAPMPAGADTVFMQEDCRIDGDAVILPAALRCGANRRFAGEDLPKGAVMFPGGRKLTAADVALAAAQGVTRLMVHRQLRVAVFSTGDEVVEPGADRPPAAIYDANRHLMRGLLRKFGAVVTDLGILRDDRQALQAAIMAAAADHDLVITSGGVSTGDADHVRDAIEEVGRLVFWRIAIKPGRPVALGVIPTARSGHTAVFCGLPGNPAAVYVTFVRVVWPLLLRLAGGLPRQPIALPVRATFAYRKRKGRREYVRVSLRHADDGAVEAVKFPRDGAGVISSLTETDGLVELGEEVTTIAPGAIVGFLSHAVLTE